MRTNYSDLIDKLISERKDQEREKIRKLSSKSDLWFNVFGLMSELYYRENFHSDVISAILDVNSKHNESSKYLEEFIAILGRISSVLIFPDIYNVKTTVSREKGRRDITIYSDVDNDGKKHAIVIENKINDAGDTFNQIPKYVLQLESEEYIVDAVVYLTLNQQKEPDKSSWQIPITKQNEIENKLIFIRAFEKDGYDVCSWLKKCISRTDNSDNLSILKQYLILIEHLTSKHMDHQYFSQFEKYLKENEDMCDVVIGIKQSIEEYPYHILTNIKNRYENDKCKPFKAIKEYTNRIFFLYNYQIAGYSFNMDIYIDNLDSCVVDFSVRGEVEYQQKFPKAILDLIGLSNDFKWDEDGRYYHKINGPFTRFEEKAINVIDDFLKRLIDNQSEIEHKLNRLK